MAGRDGVKLPRAGRSTSAVNSPRLAKQHAAGSFLNCLIYFETPRTACADYYVGLPYTCTRCDCIHTVRHPNLVDRWLSLVGHISQKVQGITAAQLSGSRALVVTISSKDRWLSGFGTGGGFYRSTVSSRGAGAGGRTPGALQTST